MEMDPRVDDYIERQADFARPILAALREIVHAACPECEETLKWGMPHFMYRGAILAHMAAFKAHAVFGFRHGGLVVGNSGAQREAMGQFGRLTSLDNLPEREAIETLVRKAMTLTEQGVKPPRADRQKAPLAVPDDLRSAVDANPAAAATFDGFPPSARRDYVEWIVEAKREETRRKRIAQAVEWLAEGKRRHWKYESC
jgi:uncharacterized protein YdeI (YjbR/CyaY-like superfamily)